MHEFEVVTDELSKWAEKAGEREFFYYGEQDKLFTYAEFDRVTNSIGNSLIKMGVEKCDRVSVFTRNSLLSALAMYSIWKTGALFSPINFNLKGHLLSYQINDTEPKFLITDNSMVSLINEIKDDISLKNIIMHLPESGDHDYNEKQDEIKFDKKFNVTKFDLLTKEKSDSIDTGLSRYDLASIIYTSGTTGPAKGVVQTHRWLHNYTFGLRKILSDQDVVYNDLPLYHVGGACFNLVSSSLVGCKTVVWDRFSSRDFWDRIKSTGATFATVLDVMIPWLMSAEETPEDRFNTLNKAYMQPLPDYHNSVAKRFGIDFIMCGYGQTEAGNGFFSLIDELDESSGTPAELYKGHSKAEIISIAKNNGIAVIDGNKQLKKGFMGYPSQLLEATILNDYDEHCEFGEVGQLAFRPRSPYLMMNEYFNKPEATLKEYRNLWFHTGDAAYQDKDGYFYFVDRMGGFFRRRGENISSYQIEDFINRHPDVVACAAFPIPASVGEEEECVVYVVTDREGFTEELLREWLRDKMPKYMWPDFIRFTEDLPKTPTNKIEKYKLRELILKEIGRSK